MVTCGWVFFCARADAARKVCAGGMGWKINTSYQDTNSNVSNPNM